MVRSDIKVDPIIDSGRARETIIKNENDDIMSEMQTLTVQPQKTFEVSYKYQVIDV
jgi:hypothetical protein